MQRSDLEHLIRAAGKIANDREIIIIGSQSVLGQFPNAPIRLLMSMEADMYPRSKPELADAVDGAIGDRSALPRTGFKKTCHSEPVSQGDFLRGRRARNPP